MHGDRPAGYRQRAVREWAAVVESGEPTDPLPVPAPRAWWWPWLLAATLLLAAVSTVTAAWEYLYRTASMITGC